MNIILYDLPEVRQNLLPLTFTRPVSKLLVGLLTIEEKWKAHINDASASYFTEDYLQEKYPLRIEAENLFINSAICPDENLVKAINNLGQDQQLRNNGQFIACRTNAANGHELLAKDLDEIEFEVIEYDGDTLTIDRPWKIFKNTGEQISADFPLVVAGRKSNPVGDPHTFVYGEENIFIEEGVKIKAAVLNAEGGPIYIGKNCTIHEGSMIQGPFGMGEGSVLNMGAKIRPSSSVGPYCKLGGEVNNAVLIGYSNKGHEGFLGNSVLGEWCNLGADTNSSNMKNNYGNVQLWNYKVEKLEDTGLQFCGLIMGDHSKCSINTMFNTGTVVGVAANIFGAGFPPKHVPSFSWGSIDRIAEYRLSKVFEVAERAMARRDVILTDKDRSILEHVFEETSKIRKVK